MTICRRGLGGGETGGECRETRQNLPRRVEQVAEGDRNDRERQRTSQCHCHRQQYVMCSFSVHYIFLACFFSFFVIFPCGIVIALAKPSLWYDLGLLTTPDITRVRSGCRKEGTEMKTVSRDASPRGIHRRSLVRVWERNLPEAEIFLNICNIISQAVLWQNERL